MTYANTQASTEASTRAQEALDLLEALTECITLIKAGADADMVGWGTAGSLGHAVQKLTDLAEFFGLTGADA